MMTSNIKDVRITDLRIIGHEKGNIYHGIRESDLSYQGFGESYFSRIKHGQIKAWKRHFKMICNIVIPYGSVEFMLYDLRENSPTKGEKLKITLGSNNYKRLTIPPGIWYGFRGVGEGENIVHNLASIEHDPEEQENIPLESFINLDW